MKILYIIDIIKNNMSWKLHLEKKITIIYSTECRGTNYTNLVFILNYEMFHFHCVMAMWAITS